MLQARRFAYPAIAGVLLFNAALRDFLDLIVPAAIRLTIGPGEQKIQNFHIAR